MSDSVCKLTMICQSLAFIASLQAEKHENWEFQLRAEIMTNPLIPNMTILLLTWPIIWFDKKVLLLHFSSSKCPNFDLFGSLWTQHKKKLKNALFLRLFPKRSFFSARYETNIYNFCSNISALCEKKKKIATSCSISRESKGEKKLKNALIWS